MEPEDALTLYVEAEASSWVNSISEDGVSAMGYSSMESAIDGYIADLTDRIGDMLYSAILQAVEAYDHE